MNRRDFAKSAALAAVGVPGAAALGQSRLIPQGWQDPDPTPKRNDAEYAICRVRGHAPTVFGNAHGSHISTLPYITYPDAPRPAQPRESETNWETCFYCGREYRFVTKIEEK